MKKCPKCGQEYEDKDLNFCYNDGELLSYSLDEPLTRAYSERPRISDDPPPTEFMGSARVTRETNWPQQPQPQAPPVVWQGNQPSFVNPPFSQFPMTVAPSQSLAIVSMCLGIASLTIGWCCYSGFLIGPAAIITGVIALVQIKSNPQSFGGKGFGIAGVATGAAFIVLCLLFIIIYGFALAIS